MDSSIFLFFSVLLVAVGMISSRTFYRITSLMLAFMFMVFYVTSDITTIFIMMVNALAIGTMLVLSHKEYEDNDEQL